MSDDHIPRLPPQARQQLAVIYDAVDVFFRLRKHIPASFINTFLHIATKEGLTVTQLAARCGVSGAVMSRHIGELGVRNRRHGPGLGLVAMVQDIFGDRRERRVVLTPKGAALGRQVLAALRGEGPMANSRRRKA